MWSRPGYYKFKIAETVILKTPNILDNWYFTTSGGQILKKNRSNVTFQKIMHKFASKLNTNFEHVAATAYHYDFKRGEMVQKDSLTLEHIGTHDFKSFCSMLESKKHQT